MLPVPLAVGSESLGIGNSIQLEVRSEVLGSGKSQPYMMSMSSQSHDGQGGSGNGAGPRDGHVETRKCAPKGRERLESRRRIRAFPRSPCK